MIRAAAFSALLCAGLTGCAALRPEPDPGPEEQLAHGLAALEVQDFSAARRLLEPLYHAYGQEPVGQRALLALAASELDARNANRRLAVAADLTGRYLGTPDVPRWTVPLAETLFLAAQELGAQEDTARVASADAARPLGVAADRKLPASTRESVPARFRRVATERDELQRRLQAAEQRLATREKELQDAQQELERIRKTIKR